MEKVTLRSAPVRVTHLAEDEIFVFVADPEARRCSAAAKIACRKFGAVIGQGEGVFGKSYVIPVVKNELIESVKASVDRFLDLAGEWDQTTFLVSRSGWEAVGFNAFSIAPLFDRALDMYNVVLPESFWKVIIRNRIARGDTRARQFLMND